MAWSWSHTPEGRDNARANLYAMGREPLRAIWAEWEVFDPKDPGNFDSDTHDAALARASYMSNDSLADSIWSCMVDLSTCTNGGWLAWACPYGCWCHMVSFTSPEQVEAE
jgi:hypothetical protein